MNIRQRSMLTVLVPIPTSEYCFLSEAVRYAALGRLPLNFHGTDGWDERDLYQERKTASGFDYEPWGTEVSQNTYQELGIGSWPPFESDVPIGTSQSDLEERWSEWHAKLDRFLDNYRLRILNLLHEGRLGARGQALPNTISVDDAAEGLPDAPWDWGTIPSNYWATARLDWDSNCAQGRGATYRQIEVKTTDLFREFPLPAARQATDVVQMGDNLILQDNARISGRRIIKRDEQSRLLGRPPVIDWTEFHVEVAARLQSGLPSKQSAAHAQVSTYGYSTPKA